MPMSEYSFITMKSPILSPNTGLTHTKTNNLLYSPSPEFYKTALFKRMISTIQVAYTPQIGGAPEPAIMR
jgi:hypothetical protein